MLKDQYRKYMKVCAKHAKFHVHAQRVLVRRVLEKSVPPVNLTVRGYHVFGLRPHTRHAIHTAVFMATKARNERWALRIIRKLVPKMLSLLYRPDGLGFLRVKSSFEERQGLPQSSHFRASV